MTLLDRLVGTDKPGLYVGGAWRQAGDDRTIAVRDPATEEVIAEVASAAAADGIDAAITQAPAVASGVTR